MCVVMMFVHQILTNVFLCILSGVETSDVLPGITNTYSALESGKIARPYFEMIGSRNVSFVMGHNAYLQCRVRHLGDKTVRL